MKRPNKDALKLVMVHVVVRGKGAFGTKRQDIIAIGANNTPVTYKEQFLPLARHTYFLLDGRLSYAQRTATV